MIFPSVIMLLLLVTCSAMPPTQYNVGESDKPVDHDPDCECSDITLLDYNSGEIEFDYVSNL